jgi:DNA-binding NarL/FixJ family response regulator
LEKLEHSQAFNLILADLNLPGLDGFAFLQGLRERRVTTPVAVISGTSEIDDVRRALSGGALGFIPKSTGARELHAALLKILDGDIYVPDEMAAAVFEPDRTAGTSKDQGSLIKPRQMDVLRLLAEGRANKEIATVLNISEATVKAHIQQLFKVLRVKNRTACVQEATRRHILSSPEQSTPE